MVRGMRGGLGVVLILGLGLVGCGGQGAQPSAPVHPFRRVTLKAGVVGDKALLESISSAQRGEWEATRGARITFEASSLDPKDLQGLDLLFFPGDRLGDLVDIRALDVIAEKLILPPPPEASEETPRDQSEPAVADPLQFTDILPAFRDQVSKYGSARIGLPYGGSALVVVYHRAAFERAANRAAADQEKLALEPPRTWAEFDALAKFFQGRDWNGDGHNDHGVALAFGTDSEGVGDAVYLSRAASLGQHRDQYSFLFDADSMDPRLESPPFLEALQGLAALKECGPPECSKFDAEAARAAFREGNVALLIDRAERAGKWSKGKAVGVSPLPGSGRVFDFSRQGWEKVSTPNRPSYLPVGGGWLIGIARTAGDRQRAAALDFARYLIGPEIANQTRTNQAFPMLPLRTTQLGLGIADPRSAPGVDSRQWADAVSRTLAAPRVIPGLRIPDAQGYLADLARGRVAAIQGEPAERALKGVAQAWKDRTAKLGIERQLWHYRRSLNGLVTTPDPPERK